MEGFYSQKLDEARKLLAKEKERAVSVKGPCCLISEFPHKKNWLT